MAISSGIFSIETVSFLKPSLSPSSLSSMGVMVATPPAKVKMVRMMTSSTASQTWERKPRGIMRPRPVSPEMAELVGATEIPRTQALKLIWAYIKEHNLQDANNKKIIICDEKLKKIFAGRDQVGFLEIAGLINPHFLK